MPAKIECPFTREELELYYWTEKKSMNTIAEIASERLSRKVNHVRISEWFKEFCIPTRYRSKREGEWNPHNKKEWPVTRGRLEELYWDEGKSLNEIASILKEEYGISVSQATLINWFNKEGIPRRNYAAAMRLRHKKNPKGKKKFITAGVQWHKDAGFPNLKTKPAKENHQRLMSALEKERVRRHKEALVIKVCPICHQSFESVKHKNQVFCSLSCSCSWRNKHRRKKALPAQQVELPEISDSLAEAIEAYRQKFGTE